MKAKQAYLLGRTYANSTSGGGSGGAVNSVNGKTGTVVLDADDILMSDGESTVEEALEDKVDVVTVTTSSSTTPTIPTIGDNEKYNLTGEVTSLTIATSSQTLAGVESTIYLTTGDTITFSYPTDITVIGSAELSANTSYVISIQNGIMVIGEVS